MDRSSRHPARPRCGDGRAPCDGPMFSHMPAPAPCDPPPPGVCVYRFDLPPPAHPIKIKAKRAGTGGPGSVKASPRVPGATPRWKTIGTGLRSHLFSPLPVPPLPPRGMPFLNLSDASAPEAPTPKTKYQNIKISKYQPLGLRPKMETSKCPKFHFFGC